MIKTLKQLPLFSSFSNDDLSKVSKFLVRRKIKRGEYLIWEESVAKSLFIIESGAVSILRKTFTGDSSIIGEESSGAIVGEIGFFDDNKRSAYVVAKSEVSALELSFTALEEMVKKDNQIGMRFYSVIARSLLEKLKRTNAALTELVVSSRFAALGQIATGVAHEINTPLTTIQLLTYQIANAAGKPTPDSKLLMKHTSTIDKMLAHVFEIIKNIRAVSRNNESDVVASSPVHEVIENTIQLCQWKIRKRNIDVQLVVVPKTLKIRCRASHLSQVLLNLICNSCDAIEGALNPWIRIEAKSLKGYVQISVIDCGTNIPKDVQDKIFTPFFSTKNADQGTGIGLNISKKIIDSYGGNLFLDRHSLHTCFTIQIPKKISQKANHVSGF